MPERAGETEEERRAALRLITRRVKANRAAYRKAKREQKMAAIASQDESVSSSRVPVDLPRKD